MFEIFGELLLTDILPTDQNQKILLSLIVPVYDEEDTVSVFLEKIHQTFHEIHYVVLEIIFINDGSTDSTLEKLILLQKTIPHLRIVELSRNFGKEAALSAGLQVCSGQIVVPIDVDLQDPPSLILEMIEKWQSGFDVVVGKRMNRDTDSWGKKKFSSWFYKIYNKISETPIPENAGDFRLMDRSVVDALNSLPESRRFMKGLFSWVGFQTCFIGYTRPKRISGETKFTGWRLWNLALEAITSFSTDPLRIWTYFGGLTAFFSFLFGIFIIFKVMILGITVPGYASLIVTLLFFGGLQLIGIGVIGEYLGRTYIESKRRPIYLIRHIYESKRK